MLLRVVRIIVPIIYTIILLYGRIILYIIIFTIVIVVVVVVLNPTPELRNLNRQCAHGLG